MSDDAERAWELLRLRRPQEAAAAAVRHLAAAPESVDGHTVLALAQSQLDEDTAAVVNARQAVHLAPERAMSHYVLAAVQDAAGQAKDAMASVERALELAPDHAPSHSLQARLRLQRGDSAGALAAVDRALTLDPEDADHHETRARILLVRGRIADAAASVAQGLRLAPLDAELNRLRGDLQLREARADVAVDSYLTALRHDPSDEHARHGLLEALRGRHRAYREILRLRQGILGLLVQHRALPLLLVLVSCALGVRLIAGTTGYNWLRGTLIAVLLVPKELANMFLLAHPIGRHALTRTEKVVATCVAVLLLAAATLAMLAWLLTSPTLADAAKVSGGSVLVLAFLHACSTNVTLTRAAKIRLVVLVVIAITLLVVVLVTR